MCTTHSTYVGQGAGKLWELVLSYNVSSRDQNRLVRLGAKHLQLLSNPASLVELTFLSITR